MNNITRNLGALKDVMSKKLGVQEYVSDHIDRYQSQYRWPSKMISDFINVNGYFTV